MKINLINTANGFLIPESDYDYELKKHLRIGETYSADMKLIRNPKLHRKYFKMINTAYKYLPQIVKANLFHSEDELRQSVEVAAGFSVKMYSIKKQEWTEVAKSIAYERMDQAEFEDLYSKTRAVLDTLLANYISAEEFEKVFLQF